MRCGGGVEIEIEGFGGILMDGWIEAYEMGWNGRALAICTTYCIR